MNSRSSIFFVLFLALFGFVASLLLIPGNQELALIYLKDKDFEKASELFEEEYRLGKRDAFTLLPLIDLKLHYGKIDEAIILMELFVQKQPSSIKALRVLSKYYQYGQRYDQYLRIEEKLFSLDPSVHQARQLARLYNFNGQYEKQIQIIESLVDEGAADKQEYLDLFHLHSYMGRNKQAFQILQNLQRRFGKLDAEQIQGALHLFFTKDGVEEQELTELILKHCQNVASEKESLELAASLFAIGQKKIAKKILGLKKFAQTNDAKYWRLKWQMGEEISDLIEKQYAFHAIDASMSALIFEYYIGRLEIDKIETFLPRMDLRELREEALIRFALMLEGRPLLSQRMLDTYEEQKLYLGPLAKALFLLQAGREGYDLSKILLSQRLNDEEKRQIILWALREQRLDFLQQMREDFFQVSLFNEDEQRELVQLFLRFELQDFGESLFAKEKNIAWAFLALASSKFEEVQKFLPEDLAKRHLLDLYYFLENQGIDDKNYPVAKRLLEDLQKRFPDPSHQALLANFYFSSKQYVLALEQYRELCGDSGQQNSIENSYRYCLLQAIKEGLEYQRELQELLARQLKKSSLSLKEKREIAYIYWNVLEKKRIAKGLFFAICQDKKHLRDDEKNLLFLSQFPQDEAIYQWFEKQALQGRTEILQALYQKMGAKPLEKLFEDLFVYKKSDKEFLDLYLLAAKSRFDLKKIEKALRHLLAISEPKEHVEFAQIAFDAALYQLSYEILSALDDKPLALLGLVQWKLGDKEAAKEALLAGNVSDLDGEKRILLHFYRACLAQEEQKKSQVLEHFRRLREEIEGLKSPKTFSKEALLAYVLAKAYSQAIDEKTLLLFDYQGLIDLYYLASDFSLLDLSLRIASRLDHHFPSRASKERLIASLQNKGLLEQALYLSRLEDEDLYVSLLMQLAAKSPSLQRELLVFLQAKLQRQEVLLQKKKEYAYLFLEHGGFIEEIIDVFYALAEGKSPKSQEVRDLLYFLGPRPDQRGLQWLRKNFEKAKNQEEKIVWAKHLERRSASFSQILGRFQTSWPKDLQDLYLKSLLFKKQKLTDLIHDLLKKERSFKRLEFFQKLAQRAELEELERAVLQRMIQLYKKPLQAFRDLGLVEYEKGDYSEAKELLGVFVRGFASKDVLQRDAEAFYTYAEILRREEQFQEAKQYYQRAFSFLDQEKSFDALLLKASLLKQMGRGQEAINTLKSLLKNHPARKHLRLTLAHFLMDLGLYEEAELLLEGKEDA